MRPPVIDLTASTSTEEEPNRNKEEEKKSIPDEKSKIVRNPGIASIPIKATAKWEREEKPAEAAQRSSERVRIPTKRYGIDLIQENNQPKD